MENPNFNLDKYQEYLNQKNEEYQKVLDSELETFKSKLKEEQKKFFEQESREFLNRMQEFKDRSFKTYAEAMKKADVVPDEEVRGIRKKAAEDDLEMVLNTCNKLTKEFLQGFES
jgi:hypothetical protein